MQYKTIVLELLEQMPELYDRLRLSRTLLTTLERLAAELKGSHEEWKERLTRSNPNSSEPQIASTALEMSLKELEATLLPASPRGGDVPPSVGRAMDYHRRHLPLV